MQCIDNVNYIVTYSHGLCNVFLMLIAWLLIVTGYAMYW